MKMTLTIRSRLAAGLATLALAACGGGKDLPSVSSMVATGVSYGRTMTVTVSGSGVDSPDLETIVEGPCSPVTRVPGETDAQMQFSCPVRGIGALTARVRSVSEDVEIASIKLNVPLPRVSMTVTQGTRSGSYLIELDPVAAPITVDNFLAYVNSGFYRNTIYHRVIEGFVAQGGGFITGPTPKPPTRPPIALESNNGLKNLQYTIAMARTSDPNSATSQFFFNLVDNPGLDFGSAENPEGYAVFGRVVSGQDVIDEIGKVETRLDAGSGQANLPVTDVVITAASQTR